MAVHIWQIQIQKNQIVVIKFCQIDPLFAKGRGVHVQICMGQHHIDAFGSRWIVLDQEYAHGFHSV